MALRGYARDEALLICVRSNRFANCSNFVRLASDNGFRGRVPPNVLQRTSAYSMK